MITFVDLPTLKPKSVVVYSYYGVAVYFDGKLVAYGNVGPSNVEGWFNLCRLLGIKYDFRRVDWETWPGADKDSKAVYNPPATLKEVEDHYARKAERERKDRIIALKKELLTLETLEGETSA